MPVLLMVTAFLGPFSFGGPPLALIVFDLLFALGVLALWYFVGLWLDRLLGLESAPTEHPPDILGRFIAWLALAVLASLTVLLVVLGVVRADDMSAQRWSLAVWVGFGVLVLALKLRRWRQLARPD